MIVFYLPKENCPIEKYYTDRYVGFLTSVIKEMGSKVCYLGGFWHHYVTTMNAHMHVYRHPLFKRRTKPGL